MLPLFFFLAANCTSLLSTILLGDDILVMEEVMGGGSDVSWLIAKDVDVFDETKPTYGDDLAL